MLFVGIDIAKRNHEASVIAQDGSVVRKAMRFANSQAGYNKFMDMVRGLKEPVVFGMEATGHYWLTLYTHLRNDGFTVHVINPIQSDALRGMYIRKTKTDSHRQRYHRRRHPLWQVLRNLRGTRRPSSHAQAVPPALLHHRYGL